VGLHEPSSPHAPTLLSMRAEGMDTSLDFARFVVEAVLIGFLASGDMLVCDNAKVHKQPFIIIELNAFLSRRNIAIVYLPTYSP